MNIVASGASGGLVIYLLFVLATYVVMGISLQKLAQRTGTSQGWMAWVPILSVFLLVRVAGRNAWEGILLFIPFVNVVFGIVVLVALARRMGESGWWALPLLIPVVNLAAFPYLAFSAGGGAPIGDS